MICNKDEVTILTSNCNSHHCRVKRVTRTDITHVVSRVAIISIIHCQSSSRKDLDTWILRLYQENPIPVPSDGDRSEVWGWNGDAAEQREVGVG